MYPREHREPIVEGVFAFSSRRGYFRPHSKDTEHRLANRLGILYPRSGRGRKQGGAHHHRYGPPSASGSVEERMTGDWLV